ncbi:MAG: signal peptidase II [Endomicrobium sp.]|nr:signal peptidase II [Endomicrobium sp.]
MKKPLIVAISMLVLDQLTKYLVNSFVSFGDTVNVVSMYDFFSITNIRNTGTAFGVFQGQGRNTLFFIFVSLLLSGLSLWLYKNWNKLNKLQQYSFCLIVAGGLGNLIDRLFHGAVVDFLDFGINSLRWPAFNIADSCISVSVCLVLADMLIKRNQVNN